MTKDAVRGAKLKWLLQGLAEGDDSLHGSKTHAVLKHLKFVFGFSLKIRTGVDASLEQVVAAPSLGVGRWDSQCQESTENSDISPHKRKAT